MLAETKNQIINTKLRVHFNIDEKAKKAYEEKHAEQARLLATCPSTRRTPLLSPVEMNDHSELTIRF